MSGWRPKTGWAHERNDYFQRNSSINRWGKSRQKDYEAGADAIIESLKKEGQYVQGRVKLMLAVGQKIKDIGENGWLVFIEEVKDD